MPSCFRQSYIDILLTGSGGFFVFKKNTEKNSIKSLHEIFVCMQGKKYVLYKNIFLFQISTQKSVKNYWFIGVVILPVSTNNCLFVKKNGANLLLAAIYKGQT